MEDQRATRQKPDEKEIIYGRNSVREALRVGVAANAMYIAKGDRSAPLVQLEAVARDKGVVVKFVDVKKLEHLCSGGVHQGIALSVSPKAYSTVEELFDIAAQRGEPPFFVILDGIEDPHNLGAVIRSALCCGAHGVIIPERRGAALTGAVEKASAGALAHIAVARVKNVNDCIKQIKKRGVWVYAASSDGTPCGQLDLSGAVALVIGSEGEGVSRLVRETCDGAVGIPIKGGFDSFNASVAAGILMYEIMKRRD
ncbi:MAG: 23S rRNA (guanosine(2251)-2'-O)-methyltransferase RlmB [Clostridia bacterium]|nr:23S rRNA (guanosine(2251)-2'-O)-methyltransferase RlmB [Clostridia bacterium]